MNNRIVTSATRLLMQPAFEYHDGFYTLISFECNKVTVNVPKDTPRLGTFTSNKVTYTLPDVIRVPEGTYLRFDYNDYKFHAGTY